MRAPSSVGAASTTVWRTSASSVLTAAARAPARAAPTRISWSLTRRPTCRTARAMARIRGRTRANSTVAEARSPTPGRALEAPGDVVDDRVEERRQLATGLCPRDEDERHGGRGEDHECVLGRGLPLLAAERGGRVRHALDPAREAVGHRREPPRDADRE